MNDQGEFKQKNQVISRRQVGRWLLVGTLMTALVVLVAIVAAVLTYGDYMQGWIGY